MSLKTHFKINSITCPKSRTLARFRALSLPLFPSAETSVNANCEGKGSRDRSEGPLRFHSWEGARRSGFVHSDAPHEYNRAAAVATYDTTRARRQRRQIRSRGRGRSALHPVVRLSRTLSPSGEHFGSTCPFIKEKLELIRHKTKDVINLIDNSSCTTPVASQEIGRKQVRAKQSKAR